MMAPEITATLAQEVPVRIANARRVLLIVPDTTRTAPVAEMVLFLHDVIRDSGAAMDVMIALGTHPPLPWEKMLCHLGMTEETYATRYADVKLMNHAWNDPARLVPVGHITADRVAELSGGLMCEEVELTLNKAIHDYDHLLILGPVFPHEVAGFSGGAKYLFPGISGPGMIDVIHWLGALRTNLKTIGRHDTPVRRLLDEGVCHVPVPLSAISFVVEAGQTVFLSVGPLRESWRRAAEESALRHIVRTPRRYRRVLSCAPKMYGDLWTAGKCMYKLEPVVEDGGELIIYAPHLASFSITHGRLMEKIGYHVRDYFLKQVNRFGNIPKAAMAVSTYLKGSGTYENGVESPRIRVSLASAIPRETCERAGLGYTDPDSIDVAAWRGREREGLLFVERAGETLYLPDESLEE